MEVKTYQIFTLIKEHCCGFSKQNPSRGTDCRTSSGRNYCNYSANSAIGVRMPCAQGAYWHKYQMYDRPICLQTACIPEKPRWPCSFRDNGRVSAECHILAGMSKRTTRILSKIKSKTLGMPRARMSGLSLCRPSGRGSRTDGVQLSNGPRLRV